VPRHRPVDEPIFHKCPDVYDDETAERLGELGLAEYVDDVDQFEFHPKLTAGRWEYPGEEDENRIPTSPRLFCFLRSNVNLQLCDSRFQAAYLAKYCTSKEEGREVVATCQEPEDDIESDTEPQDNVQRVPGRRDEPRVENSRTVNVSHKNLYNKKITSADIAANKIKGRDDIAGKPLAREISATEVIWFCLGLPYIVSM